MAFRKKSATPPPPPPPPRTLFEKIWDAHVVNRQDDGTCVIYVDRHLVHEVTSPQAFEGLRMANRPVRRPDATIAGKSVSATARHTLVLRLLLSSTRQQACRRIDQNLAARDVDLGHRFIGERQHHRLA